jgi:hypothetical protein
MVRVQVKLLSKHCPTSFGLTRVGNGRKAIDSRYVVLDMAWQESRYGYLENLRRAH